MFRLIFSSTLTLPLSIVKMTGLYSFVSSNIVVLSCWCTHTRARTPMSWRKRLLLISSIPPKRVDYFLSLCIPWIYEHLWAIMCCGRWVLTCERAEQDVNMNESVNKLTSTHYENARNVLDTVHGSRLYTCCSEWRGVKAILLWPPLIPDLLFPRGI